jgi:hypothetical protein
MKTKYLFKRKNDLFFDFAHLKRFIQQGGQTHFRNLRFLFLLQFPGLLGFNQTEINDA